MSLNVVTLGGARCVTFSRVYNGQRELVTLHLPMNLDTVGELLRDLDALGFKFSQLIREAA